MKSVETTYTKNLENVKEFFYSKLIKLSDEELGEAYTKVTQHFLFNMYEISSDIDVYVTFETMNNRGKLLSSLELLKNRLIYVSTLYNCNENNKERLRRNINNCWKKIYHILGKCKDRVLLDDEFLVTHFMLYFCKNVEEIEKENNRIYEIQGSWQCNYLLNKYFVLPNILDGSLTIEKCFDYIASLSDCIELWECIKNPFSTDLKDEIKEYIDKFNFFTINRRRYWRTRYMIDFSYLNVFILACFVATGSKEKTLLKFLKSLERYLFTFEFYDAEAVDELDFKTINFSELTIKLNKGEMVINGVIEKIDRCYFALITSDDLRKRTIRYYSKNGFYRNNWLRYFLCEYEFDLMKKSKTNISKLNRWELYENGYSSIEHIYPENSHNKYWIALYLKYNAKEKNCCKNSLGNFVAISGEKNSKLGNKSFPDKKSNKQNSLGYKYGTYAEIELTLYDDWGPEEILKRGLKLVAFLEERWGIKVSVHNKEEKKKFLGLDFLS